jgi:hypothetical protein
MSVVYRNKNFTQRDPECTNIVYAVAGIKPQPVENWQMDINMTVKELEDKYDYLYTQNRVTYYGYL